MARLPGVHGVSSQAISSKEGQELTYNGETAKPSVTLGARFYGFRQDYYFSHSQGSNYTMQVLFKAACNWFGH